MEKGRGKVEKYARREAKEKRTGNDKTRSSMENCVYIARVRARVHPLRNKLDRVLDSR